jgi:hypothetical protein
MTVSTCGSIRIACDTVATHAFDDKRTVAPAALVAEQERGRRESQTQVDTGHVVVLTRTHPSNNESTTRFSSLADIPWRNLDAGLAGGCLSRSGAVRISSYFRSL